MTVVRPPRNAPIGTSRLLSPSRFRKQRVGNVDHIGIPTEMIRLHERAVGFLLDVAQMDEIGAVGERAGNCGHVIRRARAERSGA